MSTQSSLKRQFAKKNNQRYPEFRCIVDVVADATATAVVWSVHLCRPTVNTSREF